jgi:hypothetical protein
MKASEILNEKPVESSWITDLVYNRPNKRVTMRLSNGRSFSIPGVTRTTFEQWVKSGSKGRYFHQKIKDVYVLSRIK